MLENAEKRTILQGNIKQIAANIYELTVSAQVAKSIGNTDVIDNMTKRLETLTKTLNEYEKILNELK